MAAAQLGLGSERDSRGSAGERKIRNGLLQFERGKEKESGWIEKFQGENGH